MEVSGRSWPVATEVAVGSADPEPILLLISERPERFAGAGPDGRRLVEWRPRLPSGSQVDDGTWFTGDPARVETYRALALEGRDAIGVVDVCDTRTGPVVAALRQACASLQVLVLTRRASGGIQRLEHVRGRTWAELLNGDLGAELRRLEDLARVERLRAFARAAKFLPILVQADPDPDGIASAMAVRALLRRRPATMPIVTLGQVTRPENRRFVELMGIEVERVTRAELRRYEHLIAVDVQPGGLGPLPARIAVIDHHPPEAGYSAMFRDIRPENGATATMLTQYLRADETCRLSRRLATALLYGIQTDTALLTRGARPEDVLAYVFLQTRADAGLLRRIARPSYGPALARAFGATLAHLAVDGDLVVGFAGRVEGASVHLLVDLADFCLSIAGAAWVVVGGVVEQELVLALRRAGGPPGAGTLARRIARGGGSGGGHASMARARLPIETVRRQLGDPPSRWTAKAISRIVRAELDRIG